MFPPAQKPLGEALEDAGHFASTLRRPGLVGADLVIAWKDWPGLDARALAKAGLGRPCKVAIVGVTPQDLPSLQPAFLDSLRPGSPVQWVSLELHVTATNADELLRSVELPLRFGLPTYIEPRMSLPALGEALPDFARALGRGGPDQRLGLKVRCAGANALDRTTLAIALTAAADAHIPFKATQGLHHPVPRPGFPHGFLGLLAAFRIRQARGPSFTHEIQACLAEDDVHAFSLNDGIAWRSFHVDQKALDRLPPFAIGSCSLDEPDDDLMQAFGPPRA
jgi:hypothetical protein